MGICYHSRMKYFLFTLLTITIIACGKKEAPPIQQGGAVQQEEEEIELAEYMAHFQRYAEKLYWSGKAENPKLAYFYLHELEETAEKIIEAKVTEDRHDISKYTKQFLLPALKQFRNNQKLTDELPYPIFEPAYVNLVNACNNCHLASDHGFIKIQAPTQNSFSNQVFTP